MSKELPNTSVLVLGYGREGQSAHRYLHTCHPDITVGIADQKPVTPIINDDVTLHTGENYLQSITRYNVIIRSPGIPVSIHELQEAHADGKWVTSVTNIFLSECPGMVIGITGTKGKSTTTSLVTKILESQYPDVRMVGNIGRPALDYLKEATRDTVYVAEFSSHQLEDSRYSPHIAVVLNIVPEHLDYYKTFNQYVQAKSQIVNHQTSNDIVIFNPKYDIVQQFVAHALSQKYRFSLEPSADIFCWLENGTIYTKRNGKQEPILSSKDIPLKGMANVENVLAAITVGLLLNITKKNIQRSVAEFKSLPHRLEFIGTFRGVNFYNDSLATIPEATMHALEALGPDVATLIVGGYDRGIDYSALGQYISERQGLKTLILFPDTGLKIWENVQQSFGKRPIIIDHYQVNTMKEAVDKAFQMTPHNKICLLSPASASFNLFKDYQARGEAFKEAVLTRQ